MNSPQSVRVIDFAAQIGLDWADGKHEICL